MTLHSWPPHEEIRMCIGVSLLGVTKCLIWESWCRYWEKDCPRLQGFGALRQAVVKDHGLTTKTKHLVYQACVLPVLLYGTECWTPLCKHLKLLDSFHHRCIWAVLGISRRQQWTQHLISHALRKLWGDPEPVSRKDTERRLEWLAMLPECQTIAFQWRI